MKHVALSASLLLLSVMAYAVTPSNSSLKGNYSFQLSTTKENYWSGTASVMCKNITYTFNGHGQSATTEISYGVMTFDGNGNVRVSYTDVHKFNQAASNNTVTITCNSDGTVTTYDGHPVLNGPTTVTATGTYAVQSNGTGAMTLSVGGLIFELAGSNSAGLRSTVILSTSGGNNLGTGIAIHQ